MDKKIDLAIALKIIDAARKKAQDIKVPMNIAVVDEGNNLVAFHGMGTEPGWEASTSPRTRRTRPGPSI